jgi:hypothetical protein
VQLYPYLVFEQGVLAWADVCVANATTSRAAMRSASWGSHLEINWCPLSPSNARGLGMTSLSARHRSTSCQLLTLASALMQNHIVQLQLEGSQDSGETPSPDGLQD